MNKTVVDPTYTPDLYEVLDKCQGLLEMEVEHTFFSEHLSAAYRQLRHLMMEYDKLKKFTDAIIRDTNEFNKSNRALEELIKHEHSGV